MKKIRIAIADDHQIFRDGIKSLLKDINNFEVVADVGTGTELVTVMYDQPVDVVLLDIKMPEMNGIEAAAYIKKHHPNTNILAFSMHDEENYIVQMLNSGALGYILKNAGKDELVTAIKTVSAGDSYFSREVSSVLFSQINKSHGKRNASHRSGEITITDRELEILKLITEELTNAQIAEKLFISPRTVDTHRRNLLQKLNVKNTAGLVKYAFENNLV